MANLNGDIKKYKRGELIGTIATGFCGVVLIYFIICFTVARVMELETLQLVTLITSPILMVAGIAVAAYCNLKFGKALDKAIGDYVLETCVENAASFHPERNSLTFYLAFDESKVNLQVNGYKEKVEFDFSALGKLNMARKLSVVSAIENRLTITFCRLYERGATYTDVGYLEPNRKKEKTVYIIQNGAPEKHAYKFYLKNK